MALEDLTGSGKYIDDLNSSNPAAGDNVSEGDDHIRGIKNVLKLTFPAIDGPITPSDTEINYVGGVSSSIQTQFNAIGANNWVTNARLADDAVDSAEIADGAVDLAHMSANSVDSDQYVDGSIDTVHIGSAQVTLAKMAANSVDSDQYVDGSIDLVHMSANSVDSDQYVDGSIDTAHFATGAVDAAAMGANSVDSSELVDGSVDLSHMSANSVDSDQYVDGSIDLIHMSANSVDSDQYVDGSIDTAHYAAGSVDTTALGADSVTTAKIADNVTLGGNVTVSGNLTVSGTETTVNTATLAVEDPLVSLATGNNGADAVDIGIYGLYDTSGSQDLYGGLFRDASDSGKWKLFKDNQAAPTTTVNTSGTGYAVGTLVADLQGNLLSANSVDSAQYVDGSIDREHLAADIIDGTKIANDAINSEHYVDGSIDTQHIGADQITSALIADDQINSEHIVADSLDTEHYAPDSINGDAIAADVIDSKHYAADSIDNEHLSESLGDLRKGVTYIGLDGGDHIYFDNNSKMSFTVNGGEEMRLEADGDLHLDGDVIAFSTTISDEALKYDINPVEFALDKINQLKGVSYKYKHNNRESAGLLAQDVEKIMPSAVTSKKVPLVTGDNKEYKTLHYDSMTAIFVEAIKELTAKVKKLENR